jgi:hypothetical protein
VPEAESWVVSEGDLAADEVSGRDLVAQPVKPVGESSVESVPLVSSAPVVSLPQIPVFVSLGSESNGPREEKMVGGVREPNNNTVSRTRGVESGWILGDERGGGGEGPIHSENTTHIDSNRLGAKKQGPGTPVGVPGSAKGIAQVPVTPGVSGSAKKRRARHYKNSRGEISNKVTYISSPRNSLDSSRSPHHNTVINTKHEHLADALAAAPQHLKNVEVRNPVTEEGRIV